jgi:hypothetical protein
MNAFEYVVLESGLYNWTDYAKMVGIIYDYDTGAGIYHVEVHWVQNLKTGNKFDERIRFTTDTNGKVEEYNKTEGPIKV